MQSVAMVSVFLPMLKEKHVVYHVKATREWFEMEETKVSQNSK